MSFLPHEPVKHNVRVATREELVIGRWMKRFSRVGILRTVWLRDLSDCGRYATISFRAHGRTQPCPASELYVFTDHPEYGLPKTQES